MHTKSCPGYTIWCILRSPSLACEQAPASRQASAEAQIASTVGSIRLASRSLGLNPSNIWLARLLGLDLHAFKARNLLLRPLPGSIRWPKWAF